MKYVGLDNPTYVRLFNISSSHTPDLTEVTDLTSISDTGNYCSRSVKVTQTCTNVRQFVVRRTLLHNAYTQSRRCVCTHQIASLFCVKWRHGCHVEIATPYQKSDYIIHAYLHEEQSCQISARSYLKWWSLRPFWKRSPQQERQEEQQDE